MTQKRVKFKPEDKQILLQWKHTNRLRDTTFETYKGAMWHYTQATGLTLTQLQNEALTEEEQGIPRYRKSIKTHITEYQEYLDHTNMKEVSKSNYFKTVKSWYTSLDIDVPKLVNNYSNKPTTSTYEKMLTKDLIRKMINNATPRDQAILSLAAMTGQGRMELSNMTIQQVVNAWNTGLERKLWSLPDIFSYKEDILSLDVVPLKFTRQKTDNRYWVYLPSETSTHIIEYLYERQSGRNKKLRINGLEGPLFVNKMGNPLQPKTLGKVFDYVGERCGFEQPELFDDKTRLLLQRNVGEQRVYSCHKYRKYFLNMCRRHAGTNSETRSEHVYSGSELGDFWIGHQDKGSIGYYLQYNDEDVQELMEHYRQVLPYLSVEHEVEVLTSQDKQEFQEMKTKYEEVLRDMEELKEYYRQKQLIDTLAKKYGLEEI